MSATTTTRSLLIRDEDGEFEVSRSGLLVAVTWPGEDRRVFSPEDALHAITLVDIFRKLPVGDEASYLNIVDANGKNTYVFYDHDTDRVRPSCSPSTHATGVEWKALKAAVKKIADDLRAT